MLTLSGLERPPLLLQDSTPSPLTDGVYTAPGSPFAPASPLGPAAPVGRPSVSRSPSCALTEPLAVAGAPASSVCAVTLTCSTAAQNSNARAMLSSTSASHTRTASGGVPPTSREGSTRRLQT